MTLRRLLPLAALTVAACAGGARSGTDAARSTADTPIAPSATAIPLLDSARLLADLGRLAHDSMAGRAAMTPENAVARAWLVSELRRLGLAPVGERYEHPFTMPRRAGQDSVRGVNVAGIIPGSLTPERIIVVSAHYDHVGVRNGEIFNGSDDNASGTAGALQIAARLMAARPRNSVMIVFFDAEELGLLGARAFVATPPVPLERVAANVNMDMVSRSEAGILWAAGATPYPQFQSLLQTLAAEAPVTLKLGYDTGNGRDNWMQLSDQGAFHAAKIPALLFSVEDHEDYHRPTDTPERADTAFFVGAVRTIAAFVERLDAALPLTR
jgi:hypothetical protein